MLVVHKAEEELFLLGTVSFLLVFEESIINNSCVDSSIFDGDNWALCHKAKYGYYGSGNTRPAAALAQEKHGAVGGGDGICPDGEELLQRRALQHVHIFIFLLAISHVLYTAATLTAR